MKHIAVVVPTRAYTKNYFYAIIWAAWTLSTPISYTMFLLRGAN
jgi:hypothetical protein